MNSIFCATIAAAALLLMEGPFLTARAQPAPAHDLRDLTVGMPVVQIPDEGYVNLTCASDPNRKLTSWSSWRDCPIDADSMRAVRFEFDPETSREGTLVAGHPVILTALIDDAGSVAGLKIDTDPKARLYMRKKAFLLGVQVRSRYGSEGWECTQRPPDHGEQPVGGTYVRENCRKVVQGRLLVVERDLFRRLDQNARNFVDQTQVKITREGR
jgi:hypothetical protein